MKNEENKILGVLYGMAIGDAFGMPPELWTREKLKKEYGKITDFLDGHKENEISFQYKKGQFTDDTAQALIILDSLIENNFIINKKDIAKKLLFWAKKENAFKNNILGPTSKISLEAFEKGLNPEIYSNKATSNGASMRIPPIGTLFYTNQKENLLNYVKNISTVTHNSDITISGACIIAMAVASVFEKENKEEMIKDILDIEEISLTFGNQTLHAKLSTRIKYAINLVKINKNNDEQFLQNLYDMFGATVETIDSIPCAIAIAYYSELNVKKAAILSANLGGDTDTIGAMACAICGAKEGITSIDNKDILIINNSNNINFYKYSKILSEKRGKIQ